MYTIVKGMEPLGLGLRARKILDQVPSQLDPGSRGGGAQGFFTGSLSRNLIQVAMIGIYYELCGFWMMVDLYLHSSSR